ncbi:hypothetical protein [Streptomyces sp. NPDC058867]|uniref:hypothetical protein n=1 Tax=unclassified Streptomyces TaxID=2593676 RepID=UPI0036C3DF5B
MRTSKQTLVAVVLVVTGTLSAGCGPTADSAEPKESPTAASTTVPAADDTATSPSGLAADRTEDHAATPTTSPQQSSGAEGRSSSDEGKGDAAASAAVAQPGPTHPDIGVDTEVTSQGKQYRIPGLTEFQQEHGYRYVAIVSGSEPGENGHPGLTGTWQTNLLAGLPSVVARIAADHGGEGIIPGDGEVSLFEAYTAVALGSSLYRPFFARTAGIDDAYGRNWQQNLASLVRTAGGISQDTLSLLMDRVADGRPIARGANGAREVFGGVGSDYQPYTLRNDERFNRGTRNLERVEATWLG